MFKNKVNNRKMMKKEREKANLSYVKEKLSVFKEHLTIHMIEIDRICPPPGFSDKTDNGEIARLAESIRKHGLLEALSVRRICPDQSSLGGIFTLISGKKRLAALKLLGVKTVPCCIYDTPASFVTEKALARKLFDANNDDFALSDALSAYISENPSDRHRISSTFCIDEARISRLLALQNFSEREKEIIRRLSFPSPLISALADINDPEERKKSVAECGACIEHLMKSYETRLARESRKRGLIVSLLPVFNSIERLTHQIRSTGFAASSTKQETDDAYILTLRIPKQSARILTAPEILQDHIS